jgi:putative YjhG/YagF family dehydratase
MLLNPPTLADILGQNTPQLIDTTALTGQTREGQLPLTTDMLLHEPSGNLFGLTQNVGMGWRPEDLGKPQILILSTQGGLRAEDGTPLALGYHTGHWEIGLLVKMAAQTLREAGTIPFSATVSDPCDGRSQGTTGMFDSLPYRNDAAITLRRLIRSLPTRQGVLGIATCDKGLPAMMQALAGCTDLPGVIVPGGVTLPSADAEDAGTVQTIGARFAHDLISLDYAATMGCRACGSAGGGCQFLGTAATSQVVAEAFGLALPHSALCPSGEPVWLDMAHRSALALLRLVAEHITLVQIITPHTLENAMLVHAAFGGSTNLLLHIPAIAHAAGLNIPTIADWNRVNRTTPRLVDALPNGPRNHPTVQVFMAGGVPEVMLHLRQMGLLNTDVLTVTGEKLSTLLEWWQDSPRRHQARQRLVQTGQIAPDQVIMSADAARQAGLSSTVVFPTGNLAPQGAVIKATAIDSSLIDENNTYRHRGPARVFTSEQAAIKALKARPGDEIRPVQAEDVLVLIGGGPLGTGMEETYQVTSALKYIPWGKTVPLLTDARFSGVSTGACIGHIGPEALAGGPISRVRDGDIIEIVIDRAALVGHIDVVETGDGADFASRPPHPELQPHPALPADTRLWAALQHVSGGTWAGCVYDVERILQVIEAGLATLAQQTPLIADHEASRKEQ